MMNLENCPSCNSNIPSRLKSGRVVCPKCGWTDQPKKMELDAASKMEDPKHREIEDLSDDKHVSEKPKDNTKIRSFWYGAGTILMVLGGWMMTAGFFYDPSVESGDIIKTRTYNIGEISQRSTLTNTGGFLAICGSIIITRSNKKEAT
jgi:uncharacterized Zn finger protein (UPF0148 family)